MNKDEINSKLDAIATAATTENRSLTDDEKQTVTDLEGQLQRAIDTEEFLQRRKEYTAPVNRVAVHVAPEKADDTQLRALGAYFRTGKVNSDLEIRAQNESTPSAGGFTVPTVFQDMVVNRIKSFGGIQAASRQLVTDNGREMTWRTIDDVDNVGEIINEGDTFASGADVTYGSNSLNVYQYTVGGLGSEPIKLSRQLIEDSAIDIVSEVASLLATRIYRIQARHLATGTGVGQPLGLVHGLTGVGIADNTKGIQYDDLVNWIYSIDPFYRVGAVWVLPDAVVKRIKLIKDSNGDPVFRSSTADLSTGTGGDTILGYPVVVDQGLPDLTPNSATINFGAFGRLSGDDGGYIVRTLTSGLEIERDDSRSRDRKEAELFAWSRLGATQNNTNAYVALTGKA